MYKISLVLDNIRSAHNVGAILRSADVFAVSNVYCIGVTPYPSLNLDDRLPHVRQKNTKLIAKTALGAEKNINVEHYDSIEEIISILRKTNWRIIGLEQSSNSIPLHKTILDTDTAVIVGSEVDGISKENISLCDQIVEISQFGSKESLNVSVAIGIALYQFRS